MDINKTTQMNDFSGGMNTDTSDAFVSKNTYRMAKNLRYITNTLHNSAELHMIEGAINVLLMDNVIDSTQLRDLGIVITGDDNGWLVWTYRDGESPIKIVDIEGDERVVGVKKLSLVTRYENKNNQKLYIADGKGPILDILLVPLKDENDQPIIQTDLQKISAYSPVKFNVPIFCGFVDGGILDAPVVEYSYQLYNKYGNQSEISPSTKLISIRTGGITVNDSNVIEGFKQGEQTDKGVRIKIINDNDNFNYIKVYRIGYVEGGQEPTIELIYDEEINGTEIVVDDLGQEALSTLTLEEYNSMSGIHIIPKTIESKDGYMFAANIQTDTGNLESKLIFEPFVEKFVAKSYNYEGNTYEGDNPYCNINKDYVLNEEDAYVYCDNSGDNILGGSGECIKWKFITTDIIGDKNDSLDYINAKDENNLFESNNVTKYYLKGDGVVGSNSISTVEDGKVDLSTFVEIQDNSLTYSNSQVSYSLKSLRRGELYRYGIILYDDKGNNSNVLWIADIRVPTLQQFQSFKLNQNELIVCPIGIEFEVNLEDSEDIVSYEIVRCNRGESDMSIVSQGVISRPIRRQIELIDDNFYHTDLFSYTPTGFMGVIDFTSFRYPWAPNKYIATNSEDPIRYIQDEWSENDRFDNDLFIDNNTVYQFASPEICYAEKEFGDVIQKRQLNVQPVDYVYPKLNDFEGNDDVISNFPVEDHRLLYYSPQDNNVEQPGNGKWVRFGNEYTHLFVTKLWLDNIMPEVYMSNSERYESPQRYIYSSIVFYSYYTQYNKSGETTDLDDYVGQQDKKSLAEEPYNELYKKEKRNQYIKLYNGDLNVSNTVKIKNIAIAQDLGWNDFASGDSPETLVPTYQDKVTVIGNVSFVNWVCGGGFDLPLLPGEATDGYMTDMLGDFDNDKQFMLGPGGRCAVLEVDVKEKTNTESKSGLAAFPDLTGKPAHYYLGTYLCNLRKAVTPYGGYDENARRLSTYKSFGNYFDKDKNVVHVFDGDCYIMPFEYVSQHKWGHALMPWARTSCIVYSIPVETNINLALTSGYEFSKNRSSSQDITYLQKEPSEVNGKFTLSEPLYVYNAVYSALSKAKVHAANNDKDDDLDSGVDFRIYHSMLKSDNEITDSWLKYLPSNYLDVDSRRGQITGLRRFNNQLIFWQQDATGILSVNERTAISDDSGLPLILGTGDVLSRYDYIATSNGMKEDEYCDDQSDATLYWWDHNKHELCAYSGGLNSIVLSKVKFVQNYINEMYQKNNLSEKPKLIFDKEFNELLAKVDNENAIAYNENIGQFTGVYSIQPLCDIKFVNKLLMFNTSGLLNEWNKLNGDEVVGIEGENDALYPYVKYVVNENPAYTKVFDNGEFAGRVYGGDTEALNHLHLIFSTPHKQRGEIDGSKVTNIEYNFRYAVPRNNNAAYGERLRGRTMLCELESDSNSYDFSLQFTLNKYRISWS